MDPQNILRNSSVDTRPVWLTAWEVSPGDDAMECSITDQGAPGVALSGGRERGGVLGGAKGTGWDMWERVKNGERHTQRQRQRKTGTQRE